jgi:hypothetical protein
MLSTLLTAALSSSGFFAILIFPVANQVAALIPPVTGRGGTRQVEGPHHAGPCNPGPLTGSAEGR